MQISRPGRIKNTSYPDAGFVLLRTMIVMITVVVCFAVLLTSLAVAARRSVRLLETIQQNVEAQNKTVKSWL